MTVSFCWHHLLQCSPCLLPGQRKINISDAFRRPYLSEGILFAELHPIVFIVLRESCFRRKHDSFFKQIDGKIFKTRLMKSKDFAFPRPINKRYLRTYVPTIQSNPIDQTVYVLLTSALLDLSRPYLNACLSSIAQPRSLLTN